MITGRVPWAQAHADDEHYSSYIKDRSYIMQYLPLSHSLLPTVKRVLEPHPAARITLDELRTAIMHVPHFHATDAELARAPELTRIVMADRAEQLGEPYTLPAIVPRSPTVLRPKGTAKPTAPHLLCTPLSSERSEPWGPQFQIAVRPRPATYVPALGPGEPYLEFALDVCLADNYARRLSLPRLMITNL
jgi:hypothetical protein